MILDIDILWKFDLAFSYNCFSIYFFKLITFLLGLQVLGVFLQEQIQLEPTPSDEFKYVENGKKKLEKI